MIIFGRHDETERIPKPEFGGSRGEEFEIWCGKIETMFEESLNSIESVKDVILNVQITDWYDEILSFRSRMKSIEIVVENIVNSVFDQVPNMQEAVESLAAFYNYSRRDSLKPLFERKTLYVYKMFKQEIQDCKQDFIKDGDERPSYMPEYSGRATMALLKKNRLKLLKKVRKKCP